MHPAAVAIRRMPLDAYSPVAVAKLDHAILRTDTTASHAAPSALFTAKCGDDRKTACC